MTSDKPRASSPSADVPVDFSMLVSRLEDLKEIENEKTRQNMKWVTPLLVFGLLAAGTLLNIPSVLKDVMQSDSIQQWLDVFQLAPTKRN